MKKKIRIVYFCISIIIGFFVSSIIQLAIMDKFYIPISGIISIIYAIVVAYIRKIEGVFN